MKTNYKNVFLILYSLIGIILLQTQTLTFRSHIVSLILFIDDAAKTGKAFIGARLTLITLFFKTFVSKVDPIMKFKFLDTLGSPRLSL